MRDQVTIRLNIVATGGLPAGLDENVSLKIFKVSRHYTSCTVTMISMSLVKFPISPCHSYNMPPFFWRFTLLVAHQATRLLSLSKVLDTPIDQLIRNLDNTIGSSVCVVIGQNDNWDHMSHNSGPWPFLEINLSPLSINFSHCQILSEWRLSLLVGAVISSTWVHVGQWLSSNPWSPAQIPRINRSRLRWLTCYHPPPAPAVAAFLSRGDWGCTCLSCIVCIVYKQVVGADP